MRTLLVWLYSRAAGFHTEGMVRMIPMELGLLTKLGGSILLI